MDILSAITEEYKKSDIPAFGVGDTVKVHIKIKEGQRERIQIFEGFICPTGMLTSSVTSVKFQKSFVRIAPYIFFLYTSK